MKRIFGFIILAVAMLAISFCQSKPAQAFRVSEIAAMHITNHFFTTEIKGVDLNNENYSQKCGNPYNFRLVVLIVAGKTPPESVVLRTDDFFLNIKPGQDRIQSRCRGLARISNVGMPGNFVLDTGDSTAKIVLAGGNITFALTFVVANSTTDIELVRSGTAESLMYNLSKEKRYSVLIEANEFSTADIGGIKEALIDGGYYVWISYELDKKFKDWYAIMHMDPTVTIAQEISQILEKKYNVAPSIRQMTLAEPYDIVLIIGGNIPKSQ